MIPDRLGFSPTSTPKHETTTENQSLSVLPKTSVEGAPKPVRTGPQQVFPEGYPVSKSIGLVSDPLAKPTFWSNAFTEGPERIHHQGSDFLIWKVWARSSDHPDARQMWAGFGVRGPLGETFHRQAADTSGLRLIAFHLSDESIRAKAHEYRKKLVDLKFEQIAMQASKDEGNLVGLHGVADGSKVFKVLHPTSLTILQSLVSQNAYLFTNDFKYVDVATNRWPIDLDKAFDLRACLLAPVRFGDHLGVVTACYGDTVLLKSKTSSIVPLQDVEPVMVDLIYRKLIGGV